VVLDYIRAVWCNGCVVTRKVYPVISSSETRPRFDTFPISASDAHQAADISYRQCDHWARKGWVRPSIDPGTGRSGRRWYSESDVVRLDLLRQLAQSKVNTAVAGPAVSELRVPDRDVRILWSLSGDGDPLLVVEADEALKHVETGGAWVVYNPAQVRARIEGLRVSLSDARSAESAPTTSTRTMTA